MQTYFCRLLPPRPSFAADMSPAEAAVMQEHARYWRGFLDSGKAVMFGLVAHPDGAFGIGVIEVNDAAEAEGLTANDPTTLSGRGFRWEVHPMPRGAVHK